MASKAHSPCECSDPHCLVNGLIRLLDTTPEWNKPK